MTDVIAHRGLHLTVRENTVAAFAAAVAARVSGIELDVRRTADNVLIVHHDAHLDDGRAIVSCSKAELPAYIPTLDAALDACAGVWVNVEIKNDPGEPDFDPTSELADVVVAALAARPEPRDNWLISSFWRPVIDRILDIRRHPPTAWLTAHELSKDEITYLGGYGHVAVHPWDPTIDATMIERCRGAGLRINAWTVNDPVRAAELAAMGIDGICTDVPADVVAALAT